MQELEEGIVTRGRPPRGGRGLKFSHGGRLPHRRGGRPPRGGRGLKLHDAHDRAAHQGVALLAEGVD